MIVSQAINARQRDAAVIADVEPHVWWDAGKRLGFDEALYEIARKLLTATANSAGLERQFSTLKLTYGMLRTNLGAKKLENLHFVIDR